MSRTPRKKVAKADKCLYYGHDWEEFIDPQSGGFIRRKRYSPDDPLKLSP